jgi:hypothetical protein
LEGQLAIGVVAASLVATVFWAAFPAVVAGYLIGKSL